MRVLRHALRRVLTVPAVALLAVLFLLLLPVVTAGQILSCVRLAWGGRVRFRAVRVVAFAVVYTLGELACLLACLALWLATPVRRWRDGDRWLDRHVRVLRGLLGTLIRAAEVLCSFRLRLESPRRDAGTLDAGVRPLVVLGRHAGPGASFVLVDVLLRARGRVPRIVLKKRLRLDPALDVLLSRLGCAFIGNSGVRGEVATAAIAALAADLGPRDALVLFPEGGDWTPTRHRLAVRRLRRKGLRREADAAAAMPHVLPPRPAGTFAALTAAPGAVLAVFMHTGHDDLLDAESLWAALPLRRELHMVWWNEPRPELADPEDCSRWLNDLWRRIDAWIGEQADVFEVRASRDGARGRACASGSVAPAEARPAKQPGNAAGGPHAALLRTDEGGWGERPDLGPGGR